MSHLTPEDIQYYQENGFLVKKNFFDNEEISEIRTCVSFISEMIHDDFFSVPEPSENKIQIRVHFIRISASARRSILIARYPKFVFAFSKTISRVPEPVIQ